MLGMTQQQPMMIDYDWKVQNDTSCGLLVQYRFGALVVS
jgi:hypothetical protein